MENINIFDILFDFFDVVMDFAINAFEFLFSYIRIFGYDIQLFYVLGGGVFSVLMIAWIVRRFI